MSDVLSHIVRGYRDRIQRGGGSVIVSSSGAITLTPASGQPVIVQSPAAGTIPMILRGAAGQTGKLMEFQDYLGDPLAGYFNAAGEFNSSGVIWVDYWQSWSSTPVTATQNAPGVATLLVRHTGTGTTKPVLTVKLGPTPGVGGDAFQVWDSTDAVIATIDSAGLHRWGAVNEQITVGAAGAAAALPATPTKYLKVKDSAGTTLVIPAYAAA